MTWGQPHSAGAGTTAQVEDAHRAFDAVGVIQHGSLAVRALAAAGMIDQLRAEGVTWSDVEPDRPGVAVVILPAVRECRSCRAPIYWGVSVNGKATPVDVEPTEDGNVLFAEDGHSVSVLGPFELLLHDREAQPLRLNHFVSCPDGEAWKR